MPRPPISEYWQMQIKRLAENAAHSAESIAATLKERGQVEGVEEPVPAVRTIARYVREFRKLPEIERRPYRYFVWPDSMGTPDLPWEASRAALDLTRHRYALGLHPPTTVEAKWFWRLTLAAPALRLEYRSKMALDLAVGELIGTRSIAAHWAVAYGDSEASLELYGDKVGHFPSPDGELSLEEFHRVLRVHGHDPDSALRFVEKKNWPLPDAKSKTIKQEKGEKL